MTTYELYTHILKSYGLIFEPTSTGFKAGDFIFPIGKLYYKSIVSMDDSVHFNMDYMKMLSYWNCTLGKPFSNMKIIQLLNKNISSIHSVDDCFALCLHNVSDIRKPYREITGNIFTIPNYRDMEIQLQSPLYYENVNRIIEEFHPPLNDYELELTGSCKRQTAFKDYSDIDVICLLRSDTLDPESEYERLYSSLSKYNPRRQQHSINIHKEGHSIDMVPVIFHKGIKYCIELDFE